MSLRTRVWTIVLTCGVAGALVATAVPATAQPLAEVARKEQERRKQIKTPSKVYTNEDLRGTGRLTTSVAQPEPAKTGSEAAGAAAQTEATPPADDPKKDEAYWRSRLTAARDALSRSQMFLEALQSRVNGLWADFTARDDPAQRAVIEQERQKALAEMERVKLDIQRQQKEITDIEEEARRLGVPPGWLRQ